MRFVSSFITISSISASFATTPLSASFAAEAADLHRRRHRDRGDYGRVHRRRRLLLGLLSLRARRAHVLRPAADGTAVPRLPQRPPPVGGGGRGVQRGRGQRHGRGRRRRAEGHALRGRRAHARAHDLPKWSPLRAHPFLDKIQISFR